MPGREKRRYTREQKEEAVKLVKASGESVNKIAEDLGIPPNTLHNWVRKAKINAGEGPDGALTESERAELNRLRREARRLRMERDFLKKATAFFAKETDPDSK